MQNHFRICIIGAGAIGGVVAAVLAQNKFNVQLVTKHQDLAKKISSSGIIVSGVCGDIAVPVPSVARTEELEGIFDYVLIATKADGLVDAARAVLPFLDKDSRVVSMQNGICEDMLAEVVGEERTIGCVVGWGATMHEPGRLEMTSGGEFVLGNWNRKSGESLEQLVEILSIVVPARISPDILSELYSKMIINSCITTLGVICGLYLGQMLATKRARILFIAIIREAIDVSRAMDIEVAPGAAGKLDYYKFLSTGFLSDFKRHLFLRIIGFKYRKLKSSSLQSLKRGRRTEVGNYNGYITKQGKSVGVSTPVNEQLAGMVREIENGERPISPDNFYEISIG